MNYYQCVYQRGYSGGQQTHDKWPLCREASWGEARVWPQAQQLRASLGLWCPLQTEAIYPLLWILSGWTSCSNHQKPVVYNWSILPITHHEVYFINSLITLSATKSYLAHTWGTYQVFGTDGLPFLAGCHHHFAQSLSHVFQGTGESQDSHDFTGHRDIELGLLGGKRHNRENFVKPQQWTAKVILVCIHSLNKSLNGSNNSNTQRT